MATMSVKDTIKMLNQTIHELQQVDENIMVNGYVNCSKTGYQHTIKNPISSIDVEVGNEDVNVWLRINQ